MMAIDNAYLSRQVVPTLDENTLLTLQDRTRYLLSNNEIYQKLVETTNINSNKTHRCLLAEQMLLRGHLDDVDLFLDGKSGDTLALLGWWYFLQNKIEPAIIHYDNALQAYKRELGKHKYYITQLPGLFFMLALLRQGDIQHLKQAKQHISIAKEIHVNDVYSGVFRLFDDVIDCFQDKMKPSDSAWLNQPHGVNDPYLVLYKVLACVWLKYKPQENTLKFLLKFHQKAAKNYWFWYQSVSALLLKQFSYGWKDEVVNNSASRWSWLLEVQPKKSDWEQALQALQALHSGSNKVLTSAQEVRLVWWLKKDSFQYHLEPREQKITKKGVWSRGRAVALKRLSESKHNMPYLTQHDQKICQQIKQEMYYQYGKYQNAAYYLPETQGLIAAIGHPYIFWENDVEHTIEITQGELQLIAEQHGDQYQLHFDSVFSEGDRLMVYHETKYRLRITEITEQHRAIANILGKTGLNVPLIAKQQVLDSLAAIAPLVTVQTDINGASQAAEAVTANAIPNFHLQPVGDGLQIEVFVQPFGEEGPLFKPGQGSARIFAHINQQRLQTQRVLKQEISAFQKILDQVPALYAEADGEWLFEESDQALEVLLQLQQLQSGLVLKWPKGKKIRLRREMGLIDMKVMIRKQTDWFAVSGELSFEKDEQVLDMQQLLMLLEQSPGRFVRLENGEIITLSRELQRKLNEIQAFSQPQGGKTCFHSLSATVLDELTQGMTIKASKPWKEQLQRISEVDHLVLQPPVTLQAELRDYQLEGYYWLQRLAHWGAGACLADDMGLGKTLQALAMIVSRAQQGPTLVLAPASVCINWLAESLRFAPTLSVQLFASSDRQQVIANAGPFDLIICSYGLLHNEIEQLTKVDWETIVADEAQALKNVLTKRSKAAMTLSGKFKLITTGTPIENHLGELWGLFQFINPGLLGSLKQFNQRFADPIENEQDHDVQQRLKRLLKPFILRRLKSDVLTELPEKTEIVRQIELSAEEIALYEAMRRQAVDRIAESNDNPGEQRAKVLAEIMRLRRVCCHPQLVMPDSTITSSKLQVFTELVTELLENRHKALVFSQFVGHLKLLCEWLDSRGISYQYLDGSTPIKQRQKAVNEFQAGQGDLFLISLKAGGSGLNLTAADYVIHMDPWWNPAVEDQASDRAHRIGQKRPVTIYRLVTKHTIEDKIVALHQHKRDLADSLLENSDMSGKMSLEDMLALINESE